MCQAIGETQTVDGCEMIFCIVYGLFLRVYEFYQALLYRGDILAGTGTCTKKAINIFAFHIYSYSCRSDRQAGTYTICPGK